MEEGKVSLIKELNQGKELARLLCSHIASSSSHETNELLIEKILSSYETALKLLSRSQNVTEPNNPSINANHHGSPRFEEGNPRDVYKKRKIMPRWTEQVKVCSRTGIEGSLDDGYSWRKYGQKDILGAKFPRGYYRCTHRFLQGCQATKQVQRSDEDQTIYEVTYRGRHTCNNQTVSSKKKIGLGENHNNHQHQSHDEEEEEEEEKLEPSLVTFFNFEPELEVKMEDIFPTSSGFPSTADNNNQFVENLPVDFISPSTSESNLFCLSPCHMGSGGIGQNVQSSESEVTDIVSAPTSVTNSPLLDLDDLFDKQDFQSDFPFNTCEFFSF